MAWRVRRVAVAGQAAGGVPAGAITQSRALIPIFLVVLVDVFGLTLVLPLLAIYAESLRATPLEATLLVSVFAACQLVSGPVLGRWSERTGRKPVLLLSQLGTLVGFLVMARASSLWLLFLARIIDGATAGNVTVAQAYIADNTRPGQRGRAFALIGMAFGLGFLCGPWVSGYLGGPRPGAVSVVAGNDRCAAARGAPARARVARPVGLARGAGGGRGARAGALGLGARAADAARGAGCGEGRV